MKKMNAATLWDSKKIQIELKRIVAKFEFFKKNHLKELEYCQYFFTRKNIEMKILKEFYENNI